MTSPGEILYIPTKNENADLSIEQEEILLSKNLSEAKKSISEEIIKSDELADLQKSYIDHFQKARYTNMRPETRINQKAMSNGNFISELQNLDIEHNGVNSKNITNPYMGVVFLLSFLGFTGINNQELTIQDNSSFVSILPDQENLYIALRKYQNDPNFSYFKKDKDEKDDGLADGAIGGLTKRGLIYDVKKSKNFSGPDFDPQMIKSKIDPVAFPVLSKVQVSISPPVLVHSESENVLPENSSLEYEFKVYSTKETTKGIYYSKETFYENSINKKKLKLKKPMSDSVYQKCYNLNFSDIGESKVEINLSGFKSKSNLLTFLEYYDGGEIYNSYKKIYDFLEQNDIISDLKYFSFKILNGVPKISISLSSRKALTKQQLQEVGVTDLKIPKIEQGKYTNQQVARIKEDEIYKSGKILKN